MKFIEFNLNEYIYVKLKPEGFALLEKNHNDLYESIGYHPVPEFKLYNKTDEEGWTEFQAHVFMSEFGPHISLGRVPPFETTIRIAIKED